MAGSENSPVVRAKDTAFPKGLAEVQRAVDQTWPGSQVTYTLDPGEVHAARNVEITIGDHKFWVSADRHRDAAFRLYPRQSTTPR